MSRGGTVAEQMHKRIDGALCVPCRLPILYHLFIALIYREGNIMQGFSLFFSLLESYFNLQDAYWYEKKTQETLCFGNI